MSTLFDAIEKDKASGANFSKCRKYRYLLWRIWDDSKPLVAFVGLNPSTADENAPDPTITRVINFAKSWGFGGVYMMNLFPYVTADPDKLIECEAADIACNDYLVRECGAKCGKIIFAWGNFKQVTPERTKFFIEQFPNGEALVLNSNYSPRHPLYVKGDVVPVKFNAEEYEKRQLSQYARSKRKRPDVSGG